MRMNYRYLNFFYIFVLIVFVFVPRIAFGKEARMYLSPESGVFQVNKIFKSQLTLDSGGGVGINAAESTIKYDTKYLKVKSISIKDSIFKLWVKKPVNIPTSCPADRCSV